MASIQQPEPQHLIEQLKYCKTLPTLPSVALRLIDLAERETSTLTDFAEIVKFDPALVGKLLRCANSPFYGQWRKVSSLSDAIGLMGLNATISLSLSFSLRGLAPDDGALGETSFWKRSLLTALAARIIAIELRERQPEDFLLGGLLQDIGVLAMASMFGSPYATLYKEANGSLLKQERALYGIDHAEVGAQLLKHWRLPERIYESVRVSHLVRPATAQATPDVRHLAACVAAAAAIAEAWVKGGTSETFSDAYRSVRWYLAISPDRYQRIIKAMGDEMPEMETLFEFDIIDPGLLESIQESARELLNLRNLRIEEDSAQANEHVQALERRIAMLETHTQRDPLTGLYNRVYLERQLRHEFDRATRERQNLCVAYIDIDRFKTFNDTYGHAVGDQVLINVSHRMLSAARLGDTLARYGGEEFVVLFPNTSLAQAEAVLHEMLKAVRSTPCLTHEGEQSHVTFSAGLAMLSFEQMNFHDPLELLDAADRALYQTKSTGRGRITVYQPDAE